MAQLAQLAKPRLVVVGGGPGGYAAAFLAADLGLSVTLIDPEANPGGVCVYRGCIPSKALLHVAKVITEARQAKSWGVNLGEPAIDLDKLRAFKSAVVTRLTSGTGQLVKAAKFSTSVWPRWSIHTPSSRAARRRRGDDCVRSRHSATGSTPAVPRRSG
jgi:dihydrolipoamide dehydrogenase